jgi:hypothetical protein
MTLKRAAGMRWFVVCVAVAASASAAPAAGQPPNDPDLARALSGAARTLVERAAVVRVPVKGKATGRLKDADMRFELPSGTTPALLLELPVFQAPYELTVATLRIGAGRTTEIFIPNGVFLDAGFRPVDRFNEDRLRGAEQSLVAALDIDASKKEVRYLLLFTRADLVGRRVGARASFEGIPIGGKVGTWLGSGFGLGRIEGSVDGRFEVRTRPQKHGA